MQARSALFCTPQAKRSVFKNPEYRVGRHKRLLDRASLVWFTPRARCTAPSDIGVKFGTDRD
ncbi:hypothetical protein BZG76_10590 [Salinivibrio sp. AR647]|nr:hypothetical protein BZG76_10590 [Salinivibrio sp. AR647]